MQGTTTTLGDFRPIGGALCLDFANTVDWHDSNHPVELLGDAGCLAAWAGLVGAGDVVADRADLGRAIELRDALWDAFAAAVRGRPVPATGLAVLNRNLTLVGERTHLQLSGSGVAWSRQAVRAVDALLHRIARSAADLLTDPGRLARVRMCAAEGCGWLFLDESRGARRRWCSMQSCGNRSKARAHYHRKARTRQEGSDGL